MTELPFHRDRAVSAVGTPLALAEIEAFDDVLDARSPSEFADDHLPGATSAPVLDDRERALVGTIYKERSAFEAKRAGAPLAAHNIARLIEERFAGKPRGWRPLVYCWRGGGRSGSLVHVLRQVGWDAVRLDGGYKAFRRQVVAELDSRPPELRFRVVCGPTGSGKSRLLEALSRAGAQVLDLEVLAAHRGSVLGELPESPQPGQKAFETSLWTTLSRFDPQRTVYVESESRKVGNLRVPDVLLTRMRESECLRLESPTANRVRLLMEEYEHFVRSPAALAGKLDLLKDLHGAARIGEWKALAERGDWNGLVAQLLEGHYDPAYLRSLPRNYKGAQHAAALAVRDISPEGFDELARTAVKDHG